MTFSTGTLLVNFGFGDGGKMMVHGVEWQDRPPRPFGPVA